MVGSHLDGVEAFYGKASRQVGFSDLVIHNR